jgi:hypothetical protein
MGHKENYTETYDMEIVEPPSEDGLKRYEIVKTKASGLRSLAVVSEIRHSFEHMSSNIPNSKVVVGRTISFYCHACRSLIGTKTIPLRVEAFRRVQTMSPDDVCEIHVEQYRCLACGHHTRYSLQDPIVSVY